MPPRRRPFGLALKVLGLVAVAVVAGLVWVAVQQPRVPGRPIASPSSAAGQFAFTPQPQQDTSTDCVAHSFGQVRDDFFAHTPCVQLVRSLYTTTTTDGRKVVVSVAVVRLPDAAKAAELKQLVDLDKTGNVYNLIKEKHTFPGGPTTLGDSGYKAEQNGSSVTIVETGYFDQPEHNPDPLLKTIATDALRLGR
jgi:hypothetical protein